MGSILETSKDPRIAVLVNSASQYTKPSFTSAISSVSPNATIDFYDPIEQQIYPDPSHYDLIVLSGGSVDPSSQTPWVLKMREFLQATFKNHPKQKIIGICWGHQIINITLGGVVSGMEKAEMGVETVQLAPAGVDFYGSTFASPFYNIHEYHAREVKTPGKGLVALADGHQSFRNAANTVITFQGHPEMTGETAKKMLGNVPSYMGVKDEEKVAIRQKMDGSHDGLAIWKRIFQWIGES